MVMANRPERERTRLDLNPADFPADEPVPTPAPVNPAMNQPVNQPMVEEEVVDSQARRVRVVRTVCTVINLICGLFAIVLGLHVLLVLFDANPNNGFASLINSWSGGISLGLRGLFTPDNEKLQVLLNDGLAAIACWSSAPFRPMRSGSSPCPGRDARCSTGATSWNERIASPPRFSTRN